MGDMSSFYCWSFTLPLIIWLLLLGADEKLLLDAIAGTDYDYPIEEDGPFAKLLILLLLPLVFMFWPPDDVAPLRLVLDVRAVEVLVA